MDAFIAPQRYITWMLVTWVRFEILKRANSYIELYYLRVNILHYRLPFKNRKLIKF